MLCCFGMQNPDRQDLLQASRYFKKALECPYDAARALTKLQAIWNVLLSQSKPPAFIYGDIGHVRVRSCCIVVCLRQQ